MLYKKFGGDNFTAQMVGEAKLRQLEGVDAPYLSASGPGFVARKRGVTNEVWLEGCEEEGKERIPDFAVHYAEGWITAYKLDGKFSFRKIRGIGACGEYVGDGEFIHLDPPEINITNRELWHPMYSSATDGGIYTTSIFSITGTIRSNVTVHQDLKVIPTSDSDNIAMHYITPRQGYYTDVGGSGWEKSLDIHSTMTVKPWKGIPVFCGVVGGYKVITTPSIINDGSADDAGYYRGVGVLDIHLTRRKVQRLRSYDQKRIYLEFPGVMHEKANEVTGTITVVSPGVFVVLSAQSFRTNGVLEIPEEIYLWHTLVTVTIDNDGKMVVDTKTYRLFDEGDAAWLTPSEHYTLDKTLKQDHRILSQSPSILCEDGKSIIYAMSPYKTAGVPTWDEYCCVAYVKVEITGKVVSGFVTKPEITIAKSIQISETDIVMDKGKGVPAACDLLFIGNSTMLSMVREFESPLHVTTDSITGRNIRFPQTIVPPTPYHNRIELWISRDDGATWSFLQNDIDGVQMSSATVGIPSIIEPCVSEGEWPTVALPVRRSGIGGEIDIYVSKDGLNSFDGPAGKYKDLGTGLVDASMNNGKFDLFSIRGDYLCHPGDQILFGGIKDGNIYKENPINDKNSSGFKLYAPAFTITRDVLKVPSMYRVAPNAASGALKIITRVAINGRLTPKDLVRPWIYDSAYEKPKEP